MRTPKKLLLARALLLAGAVLVVACSRNTATPAEDAGPAAPVIPAAVLEQWLGTWTGPEGTSLTVSQVDRIFTVRIKDLDRTTSFQATPVADGLQFERRGTFETLRATDGAGTGMKWLAEKQECLTVRAGEGYCRH